MISTEVWDRAWGIWKWFLLIFLSALLIGILTIFFGDFVLPLFLVVIGNITIVLYIKSSARSKWLYRSLRGNYILCIPQEILKMRTRRDRLQYVKPFESGGIAHYSSLFRTLGAPGDAVQLLLTPLIENWTGVNQILLSAQDHHQKNYINSLWLRGIEGSYYSYLKRTVAMNSVATHILVQAT